MYDHCAGRGPSSMRYLSQSKGAGTLALRKACGRDRTREEPPEGRSQLSPSPAPERHPGASTSGK
jgi:hypothetical protein